MLLFFVLFGIVCVVVLIVLVFMFVIPIRVVIRVRCVIVPLVVRLCRVGRLVFLELCFGLFVFSKSCCYLLFLVRVELFVAHVIRTRVVRIVNLVIIIVVVVIRVPRSCCYSCYCCVSVRYCC